MTIDELYAIKGRISTQLEILQQQLQQVNVEIGKALQQDMENQKQNGVSKKMDSKKA
jgi:hypothetical protein